MTTYSEVCKKCGYVQYLEDYIDHESGRADMDAWSNDMRSHASDCPKKKVKS